MFCQKQLRGLTKLVWVKSNRPDRCGQTAARSPYLNGNEAVYSCGLLGDGGKSGKFGSGIVQMPADGSGAKASVMGADVAMKVSNAMQTFAFAVVVFGGT